MREIPQKYNHDTKAFRWPIYLFFHDAVCAVELEAYRQAEQYNYGFNLTSTVPSTSKFNKDWNIVFIY